MLKKFTTGNYAAAISLLNELFFRLWKNRKTKIIILINPELIKVSSSCIEYVMIHELCHLIEKNHSKKIYSLLENIAPDWQRWKLKLEKM